MISLRENCHKIHEVVASVYDLNPKVFWQKKDKSYKISRARYVCWALASNLFGYPQLLLAKEYGFTQGVVSYGMKKVQQTPQLKRVVDLIEQNCAEEIAPAQTLSTIDFEKIIEIKATKLQQTGNKVTIPRRYYARPRHFLKK